MKLLFLILSLLLLKSGFAFAKPDSLFLKEADYKNQIEFLRSNFSNNKIIPENIQLECLTALSFYPELKNTFIEFRWKNDLTATMRTIPNISSFLFKKEIKYIIYLNFNAEKTGLKISDLSFNAKVGWLGHELAHVKQCYGKSKIKIMNLGIKLLSKRFVRKHERETDLITINHGLGYALYEGSYYAFNNSNVKAKYQKNIKKNYLSPDEIIRILDSK